MSQVQSSVVAGTFIFPGGTGAPNFAVLFLVGSHSRNTFRTHAREATIRSGHGEDGSTRNRPQSAPSQLAICEYRYRSAPDSTDLDRGRIQFMETNSLTLKLLPRLLDLAKHGWRNETGGRTTRNLSQCNAETLFPGGTGAPLLESRKTTAFSFNRFGGAFVALRTVLSTSFGSSASSRRRSSTSTLNLATPGPLERLKSSRDRTY